MISERQQVWPLLAGVEPLEAVEAIDRVQRRAAATEAHELPLPAGTVQVSRRRDMRDRIAYSLSSSTRYHASAPRQLSGGEAENANENERGAAPPCASLGGGADLRSLIQCCRGCGDGFAASVTMAYHDDRSWGDRPTQSNDGDLPSHPTGAPP